MSDELFQRGPTAPKDEECPVEIVPVAPEVLPPERPEPPCDPITGEPIPETYTAPDPPPATQPPSPANITPLVVPSAPVILTCEDLGEGPIGDAVSLPSGAVTREFIFQNIEGIRDDQLAYIAGLTPLQISAALTADVEAMKSAFRLSFSQATEAVEEIAALQAEVDASALETAQGLIFCVWENAPQTAACGSGAILSPNPPDQVNNPVTVGAGQFTSIISQEDANEQALQEAQRGLSCWWGNAEVTVDCTNLGFTKQVPNDALPVYPEAPLRKGTVTLAAGTVFSPSSQADADQQATQLALLQLNCVYFNDTLNLACADLEFPDSEDLGPADPVAGTTGSYVVIPEGFVISQISTDDANEQARSIAESLLECYYVNEPQTVTCPDQVAIIDGENVVVPPSSNSAQITFTVPAKTVQSQVSVVDANAQALALANAQLRCMYCNVAVAALCLPDSVAQPPLPITATPNSGWSLDATLGVAAGTFCDESAQAAQLIAQTVGDIPTATFATGDNCTYGNDEFKAACVASEGVYGKFDAANVSTWTSFKTVNTNINPFNGERADPLADHFVQMVFELQGPVTEWPLGDCSYTIDTSHPNAAEPARLGNDWIYQATGTGCAWYTNSKATDSRMIFKKRDSVPPYVATSRLSPDSVPNPYDPTALIVFAANTFIAGENDVPPDYEPGGDNRTKNYANKVVRDMAISMLDCFFTNGVTSTSCGGNDTDTFQLEEDGPEYYKDNNGQNILVKELGSVFGNSPEVKAGIIVSYESKGAANSVAASLVNGMLVCAYGNDSQTASCGLNDVKTMVSVPRNTVTAGTVEQANITAAAFAQTLCESIDLVGDDGGGDECMGTIRPSLMDFTKYSTLPPESADIDELQASTTWIATAVEDITVIGKKRKIKPGGAVSGTGLNGAAAPCNFYLLNCIPPSGWRTFYLEAYSGTVGAGSVLEIRAYFTPVKKVFATGDDGRVEMDQGTGLLVYTPGATTPNAKFETDGKVTIYKEGTTTAKVEIYPEDIPDGEVMKPRETLGCDNKKAMVMRTDWYD